MSNLDKMANCHLCKGLNKQELDSLLSIISFKRLSKDEILFFEGDSASGFFVLLEGKIRIYKASPDGKEYTIHIIQQGQIFAEAAIFQGDKFPANCSALMDSDVAFFPKDAFIRLLSDSPQISLKIIAALSGFVRDFNRQVEELSLKEVPARIASYLLNRYYKSGKTEFELDVSKTELANRLGTISETLSRNFKKLRDNKAIDVDRQSISLLNIELLEQIADGKKS